MVLASEFGRAGKVKYPGVGKKTHSVFAQLSLTQRRRLHGVAMKIRYLDLISTDVLFQ